MKIIKVSIDLKTNLIKDGYCYKINEDDFKKLKLFSCVKVTFNKQIKIGYVISLNETSSYKLTEVIEIIQSDLLNEYQLDLLKKMIEFYKVDTINLIDLFVPSKVRKVLNQFTSKDEILVKKQILYEINKIEKMTVKQSKALDLFNKKVALREVLLSNGVTPSILNTLEKKEIIKRQYVDYNYEIPYKNFRKDQVILTNDQLKAYNKIQECNKITLLHGVTSSGKTEIYIELIKKCVLKGTQSLVVVPENTLTFLFSSRFFSIFGDIIGVIYEDMDQNAYYNIVKRVENSSIKVVIGSKKSLFLPYQNLELLVVDEEHSFKHQNITYPYYKISELVELCNIPKIVIASATPDVVSYAKAQKEIYEKVELKNRFKNKAFASIEIISQNDSEILFDSEIINIINVNLLANKKVLIYHNRLGYNTLIECEQCSHTFVCPLCSTGLIYNKKTNTCSCNYCNYSSYINKCPICKSSKVKKSGYGIEKVVEFLNKIYNQEILIIDSRSVKKKSYLKYVLSQLAKDESMIIVGTNTVINGLDIGNLDLVVTTSIDNQLFYSNFKARENLFQVLTQLAGRTGRVSGNGHMIIQTGSKNNSVLNSVVSHDYVSFYKNEMRIRKQTKMPPFYNLCQLITYAKDLNYLKLITKSISEIFLLKNYDVILKEPFHNKLRDEYYLLLNIKYKNEDIKKDCTNIIKLLKEKRINYKIDYKIAIDIS